MASGAKLKKVGSEGASSESGGSESGSGRTPVNNLDNSNMRNDDNVSGGREKVEYFGWVYHLGVNSIGHEYCHLRFLFIRGKYVEMYKRDPHDDPSAKPIRRGVAGHTLMVEELGRRKINLDEFYVLRFYNRLDETRKGEIACDTASDARKWMEAFDHAKQRAAYELSRGGSARKKLNMENEINLEGRRPRVRRYARGLKKLIRIGQGPEMLLRRSSSLGAGGRSDAYFDADSGDVVEAHQWKCVRTVGGVRIFEDVSNSKSGKGILVKAVGVVDASADTVFEIVLNLDPNKRYEWDTITGDLEMLDSVNGHYDVVYGTFNPRYLTWWQTKRDFIFSRQWFRGQDGTYTILQFPCEHKKRPSRSGFERTIINRLKEYVGANPALASVSSTTLVQSEISHFSSSSSEFEDAEMADEFYDAISADSSSEDEDDDDDIEVNKDKKIKLKNVSWAIASLALKRTSGSHFFSMSNGEQVQSFFPRCITTQWAITSCKTFNLSFDTAPGINKELNSHEPPINLEPSQFYGSMRRASPICEFVL